MIAIFQVTGSFGIRGGLKVRPYIDDLFFYNKAYDENGNAVSFSVKNMSKREIVFIDGVADKTSADNLRGATFYVEENELRPLKQNQFYAHNLIGEKIAVENSDIFCEIVSVQNYGAGDLIELSYDDKKFLVPFTEYNFPHADSKLSFVLSADAFRNFR